jgi:SsrA-binding protein
MPQKTSPSMLAQNKKAFVDYEVLEKIEAGVVLSGPEVKSVRASHANLKGSFVEINEHGEVYARNIHISPYKFAPNPGYLPDQKRKLLLSRNQIIKLQKELDTKGTTVIPLDLHLSHNYIKMTIGICTAKKRWDRRNELKKKAQNLEIQRTLKRY